METKNTSVRATIRFLLSYILRWRGLTLLCVLCVILNAVSNICAPYLLRPIINDYIPAGDWAALCQALVILAVIYVVGVASAYLAARIMIRLSQRTTHAIRSDLFTHIQHLPVSYLDSGPHGDLMSCFTGDIETISDAVNTALNNILSGIITFVGVLVMMLWLSPLLTLVSCCFLVAMYGIVKLSGSRSRFYFGRQQKQLANLNGYIQEMISGQKVVKVTGHEAAAVDGFQQRNTGLSESTNAAQIFAGSLMPALGGTASINTAISCCVGAVLVILGHMDLGSLVAYSQYLRQAGTPVATISSQFNLIMAATAGTERIMHVLEQPTEPDEGTVTLSDGQWNWAGETRPLAGHICFEDVSFGYKPSQPVLQNLSFAAQPGQKIALVGSTGAGKTTILSLLTRFYDVTGGQITYDGLPLETIEKASLRRSFSMVLQDTHLFTGTVRENIRFGRPDASDEDVLAAAKLASAHFFISHLPQGYDTVLEADGGNLSAGQRQLIAIARSAIADPAVLLLDEATAAVDTWTERQIEQGLDRLMEGKTVFIIAHRLSTVRNADCILVLEHGQILEQGTHETLLAQRGRYYDLYTGSAELT
jgi:ATP-binding cassette subfamily B protein